MGREVKHQEPPAVGTAAMSKPEDGPRRLFKGFESRHWLNLATAAIALLWAMDVAWVLASRGLFEYMGIDFRTLRAAAQVARTEGYASVYNLEALEPVQHLLYDEYSHGPLRMAFETVPMPYLPAFVALLHPLLLVPPVEGYIALVAINLVGCYLYFRRLRYALPLASPWPTPLTLLVSLPVVLTAFVGQVNLLLLIAFGEGILAAMAGRRFRGGLWIGGLLLKPQTLILLGPVLLLTRQWRMLAGLGVTSLIIAATSVLLAGPSGLVDLFKLILLSPQGLPATFPESMMNWRAMGILLEGAVDRSIPGLVVIAGALATIVAVLYIASARAGRSLDELPLVATGAFVGGLVLAWHSHVYVALPVLPWLAYLSARGAISLRLLAAYVLLPAAILAGGSLVADAGRAHICTGLLMLALNLLVLAALSRHLHLRATHNRRSSHSELTAGPS